jgi:hypothetical protein
MGTQSHLKILDKGVAIWNQWRIDHPRSQPNLTRFDLSGRDLSGVDLRGAGLFKTNLTGALLVGANLRQTRLVNTVFKNADRTGAAVYGTSVWDVDLEGAVQKDLVITPPGTTTVTVDDLEVAQFIYLLLNNKKIRTVIDTITSKVVLILGRFKPDRKVVLDRLRDELRARDYLPVLFDFEGPLSRDPTETVSTMAHLARYVIADLTEPACIPHELQAIVPATQVPIIPLLLEGQRPYAMFEDLKKYQWVLDVRTYKDQNHLIADVLEPALREAESVRRK